MQIIKGKERMPIQPKQVYRLSDRYDVRLRIAHQVTQEISSFNSRLCKSLTEEILAKLTKKAK